MDRSTRSEKIKLLQTKNRRKLIINTLEGINISLTLNSFLDIDYSINFLEKLFITIDDQIQGRNDTQFVHSTFLMIEQLSLIKSKVSPDFFDREVLLFNQNFREIGAIVFKLGDVFKDITWMVEFSGYAIGHWDFILIDPTLDFGICVERSEYLDTFISWGFFNHGTL